MAADPNSGGFAGHFWSLAIEEHFYVLWPSILIFAGRRRAMPVAAVGAVACAWWRLYESPTTWTVQLFPGGKVNPFYRVIRTDERLDGLLVGCLLAILLASAPEVVDFIRRNFPKETPILCFFPILFLVRATGNMPTLSQYILIAVAIASTLVVNEGLAFKLLTWKPLVWIGQISYGLYIWQQFFLLNIVQNLCTYLRHPLPFSNGVLLAMNLALAILTATGSYYLLERSMISIGKLKAPRASSYESLEDVKLLK
jgi:peptidoglycan/LPS O-acetylase OafA/YrhL